MTSQAPSDLSTASNHTNPFLARSEDVYVSEVPLPATTSGSAVASSDFTAGTTGSGTGVGGSSYSSTITSSSANAPTVDEARQNAHEVKENAAATAQQAQASAATTAQQAREQASAALANVQASIPKSQEELKQAAANAAQAVKNSLPKEAQYVTADHPQGHAGALAPNKSTIAPAQVPAGTDGVTNILTGIAGAVLSAPAAALEALSPRAAQGASDGVAFISSKLPAVSLNDVTATANNAANTAYQSVPHGTAATVNAYLGAAVQKAQEVLPPALGGSSVKGNTGEGQLAKDPSQLASEYGTAAQQSASNAATNVQASLSSALGTAQQKASEASTVASQKANEASAVASQKASEVSDATSRTASDVSNRASATADNVASSARQQTGSATTSDYTSSSSRQPISDSSSYTADSAAYPSRQTGASDYSSTYASQSADASAYSSQPAVASSYSSQPTGSSAYSSQSTGTGYSGSAQSEIDEYLARNLPTAPASTTATDPFGTATVSNTGRSGEYEIANPTGDNAVDRLG